MSDKNCCDFCDKPITNYGSYHCYVACDEHAEKGEEIERKMWETMEYDQDGII